MLELLANLADYVAPPSSWVDAYPLHISWDPTIHDISWMCTLNPKFFMAISGT